MEGSFYIPETKDKASLYEVVLPQVRALTEGEECLCANLANIAAVLKEVFGFFWVGFYLVDRGNPGELVLGPFQGPVACTRITKGKGVCGTCWEKEETLIVDDVEEFPGHIACNAASRSEIVVPVRDNRGEVIAVLDVDSDRLFAFDNTDKKYLEELGSFCKDLF